MTVKREAQLVRDNFEKSVSATLKVLVAISKRKIATGIGKNLYVWDFNYLSRF